jgi:succinate dehydrogenase/fumarate reductase flavoprotein subunit
MSERGVTNTAAGETLRTDVLVIGGGPAGTWAAIKAVRAGAEVILADKGHTGSSGATASVGTGIWYVDDVPQLREAAMASRETLGGHLAEREWMERVLDETHSRMDELAVVQRYPFPVAADGRSIRDDLQGPEYMRRQRSRVQRLGVRILDHTPALELLVDRDGVVSGAVVLDRISGRLTRIEAGAVVLAAGGCAFQSKTLGCDVNTGDGALMAAEAGAVLSGMEFSNSFAIAPKGTSLTKTAYYSWATFYRSDLTPIEGAGSARGRTVIAETLGEEPVFARIDRASADEQRAMRMGQPNFFLVFDRLGIDPFSDFFEISLVAEGTVRGTGGVRVADFDCATDVPGLYAAGDTATRELICGGFTGGGSHNAAWAVASGSWAGRGAAAFASGRRRLPAALSALGGAGLRPDGPAELDHRAVTAAVQRHVLPHEHNLVRHADHLRPALQSLHDTWGALRRSLGATGEDVFRAREAAAMAAHARWMYHAALHRTETRGMHKRSDHAQPDPAQHHRLLIGGLDQLWTRPEKVGTGAEGGRAA